MTHHPAAQLTPHRAMVAWGSACRVYADQMVVYNSAFDAFYASGKGVGEAAALEVARDVVDDAYRAQRTAWHAAYDAYLAAGQPAGARMLGQLNPVDANRIIGDAAAEIEAIIDAVLTPPAAS